MFQIGLAISTIPLFLWALTYWYYDIHIPKLTKNQENGYVGTYLANTDKQVTDNGFADKKTFILRLNSDNTFELEKNDYLKFSGRGTWAAGETGDGQLTFKSGGSIVFWATPYNFDRL